jgi:hypothetical protein
MPAILVMLLLLAVVFASIEAWQSRSFGWAALACLFAGAFALPALASITT